MTEFRISNHLLGNRAALDAAWERDGYWFFRNVLDQQAVARLRNTYLDVLKDIGVIDQAGGNEAIYNGRSLENYPIARFDRMDEDSLFRLNPMKEFVANPLIHDFFKRLIDDEPVWLPVSEYHCTPPNQSRDRERFVTIHRDSTSNPCIPFRICWIPLVVIDEDLGGIVMTEGLHRPRPTDNPPSPIPAVIPIPPNSIPSHAWRRTTYRPGDLLVFDQDSPHSGVLNYSDRRFRLSMDIRLMAASDKLPMVGTVTDVDDRSITVRNDAGATERYTFDAKTLCRNFIHKEATHDEIARWYPVGSKVIVSSEDGNARLIRPQR